MLIEELERLLDGAEETDQTEYKASMAWDVKKLIKDILAMANLRDGGHIIIGVEESPFKRTGISSQHLTTYNIDKIKDQIYPYADPYIDIKLIIQEDSLGMKYAILRVNTFDQLPVICKRDGTDVNAGDIYFRSKTRRAASARVSNSNDMRDIVEMSIARRSSHMRELGLEAKPIETYNYSEEIGEL